jgi:glycolate oxidase FAD binding subunit
LTRAEAPESATEAAEALRSLSSEGVAVRVVGGATKLDWGRQVEPVGAELTTTGLCRAPEHNAADLTAVIPAGVRLAEAQEVFAAAGQMLALDPPLGPGDGATVGGVVAAGDSGPLRHRYGGARDLLLGMQVALADGTLARSGGRVIKNVAGYDLAKLFSGSFGTLGLITEVVVRLQPTPVARVTAVCETDDPSALQRAALALAAAPLELESLDVAWSGEGGAVLARLAGASAERGAADAIRIVAGVGVSGRAEVDDEAVWRMQRSRQRSEGGLSVRVSALTTDMARVVECARRLGANVSGRAALGVVWLTLPAAEARDLAAHVEQIRNQLAPCSCVVLDAPAAVRGSVDVWARPEGPETKLMQRVKARFDPHGTCNPGIFVANI